MIFGQVQTYLSRYLRGDEERIFNFIVTHTEETSRKNLPFGKIFLLEQKLRVIFSSPESNSSAFLFKDTQNLPLKIGRERK